MFRALASRPNVGRLVVVSALAGVVQTLITAWLIQLGLGAWWLCNAAALLLCAPVAITATCLQGRRTIAPDMQSWRVLVSLLLAAGLTQLLVVPNLLVALVVWQLSASWLAAVIVSYLLTVPTTVLVAAALMNALPWPQAAVGSSSVTWGERYAHWRERRPVAAKLLPLLALLALAALLIGLTQLPGRIPPPVADINRPAVTLPTVPRAPTPTVSSPPGPGVTDPTGPVLPPSPDVPPTPAPEIPAADPQAQVGIASWFYGPRGSCAAKGFARDTFIRISDRHGHAVTCRVTMTGPRIRGRIVNLPRSDFAALASPRQGLTTVVVQAIRGP